MPETTISNHLSLDPSAPFDHHLGCGQESFGLSQPEAPKRIEHILPVAFLDLMGNKLGLSRFGSGSKHLIWSPRYDMQ